jgi:hypothetical protein
MYIIIYLYDVKTKSFTEQERSEGKHLIYLREKYAHRDDTSPYFYIDNSVLTSTMPLVPLGHLPVSSVCLGVSFAFPPRWVSI